MTKKDRGAESRHSGARSTVDLTAKLIRKLLSVPKEELEGQEEEYKRKRKLLLE